MGGKGGDGIIIIRGGKKKTFNSDFLYNVGKFISPKNSYFVVRIYPCVIEN